jgi:hypothetical protein
MATGALVLSTDSHVLEPTDLWTTRLPAAYSDRAPTTTRRGVTGCSALPKPLAV